MQAAVVESHLYVPHDTLAGVMHDPLPERELAGSSSAAHVFHAGAPREDGASSGWSHASTVRGALFSVPPDVREIARGRMAASFQKRLFANP